jgi:hypothetical protein
MEPTTENLDVALTAIAMAKNSRIRGWYGARGGSSRREYRCYLCDCTIDTESARHAKTKHAERAIDAHRDEHRDIAEALSDLKPVSTSRLKTLGITTLPSSLGRLITGVWCVPVGTLFALFQIQRRETTRLLDRMQTDVAFRNALDAAAAVPMGVRGFLCDQGFEVKVFADFGAEAEVSDNV